MKEHQVQKLVFGLVIIIFLVKILKRLLRIPRPIIKAQSTFGMPSTRAASLFFIAVYLMLTNKLSKTTKILLIVAVILSCSMKYFLKEHSIEQLVAGAILGIGLAYIIDIIPPFWIKK